MRAETVDQEFTPFALIFETKKEARAINLALQYSLPHLSEKSNVDAVENARALIRENT